MKISVSGIIDRVARRLAKELRQSSSPAPVYLGDELILTTTSWGGKVVVPGYNIDVSVGIIRDQVHEPWTTRLVQELLGPGQTYVNVGANFGYYTVLGGRIVGESGRVYALEANPHVFSILMKTIFFSGLPNVVEAYNRAAYAASNKELQFTFDYQYIGGGHLELRDSTLAPSETDGRWNAQTLPKLLDDKGRWVKGRGLMHTFSVSTIALDDIVEGAVDMIQCDVEQAEPYVLAGATKTIRKSDNLKIIFEWSGYAYNIGTDEYRATVYNMWSMLSELGYNVRYLLPKVNFDGSIQLSPPLAFEDFITGQHGDYLAIKRSQDRWAVTSAAT